MPNKLNKMTKNYFFIDNKKSSAYNKNRPESETAVYNSGAITAEAVKFYIRRVIMKPLEKVCVLDLSTTLSGPSGSMMLADLGAEVIKIETPQGDGTRNFPPHIHKGMSMYFMAYNRNKKSVVLDLKTQEGKDIFYDMVKHADIVWDNFRPGVKEKLKVDYDTVSKINPRIISCSITGYGSDGGRRPSYDLCVQALSGAMAMTGEADRPPVKLGVPMADIGGGWHGVVGVLAALVARQTTGKGQMVDISMLDSLVSLHGYEATYYLYSGIVPERLGTGHRTSVPYQIFATKDIYISLVVVLDKQWPLLCDAIGLDEEVRQKYATNKVRLENRNELVAIIQNVLLTKTADEWIERLEKAGVPCGAVNPLDRALSQEDVKRRNMVVSVKHKGDEIKLLGNPIKMSDNTDDFRCPPELGADTYSVLKDMLNYDDGKIKQLQSIGAIACEQKE